MARVSLDFILENNMKDGEIYARYREGHVAHKGYLDDYAFPHLGLIEMHQTTLEDSYLKAPRGLPERWWRGFGTKSRRASSLTGKGAEELIVRPKETYDGAKLFRKLGRHYGPPWAALTLLGAQDLEELAAYAISAMLPHMKTNLMAHWHLLSALEYHAGGAQDIRIAGQKDDAVVQAMISYVRRLYLPNAQIILDDEAPDEEDRPRLVICRRFTCGAPIYSVDELQVALMTGRPAT